jgi:hypothetical protein
MQRGGCNGAVLAAAWLIRKMTTAQWFTHREHGGFPIERAALGSCDLSVLYVGGLSAQRQAETVALKLR